MNPLTRPDARDYMGLPYEERDWHKLIGGEARGLRIGLLAEVGYGTKPQPAVKAAIAAAAKLFEAAGALVEPVRPFLTEAMIMGLNTVFQARAYADFERMPPERQARVLPFIAQWCSNAKGYTAADAMRGLGQVFAMREAAVFATEPYDVLLSPTSPITAYDAEEACPGNDTTRAIDHLCFTAPDRKSVV